jgi:hypothetical protein
MWKRHHKLLLGLSIVGVFVLLYLLYKRGASSGGGSGAGDTSNIPTIISTGGGGISFPMTQSGGAAQSYDATIPGYPAANPTYTAPHLYDNNSMQVMPGTSQSGVPAYTAQAQEFSTTTPIPTPSAATAAPSFYKSAAELPYQQIGQTLVADTTGPGAGINSHPDLASFLQQDVRSFELNATGAPTSAAQAQSTLTTEAGAYCGLHPEACAGADQTSLISSLSESFQTFLNAKATIGPAPTNAYQNPTGINPEGPVTMSKDPITGQVVWLAANQQPTPGGATIPASNGAPIPTQGPTVKYAPGSHIPYLVPSNVYN